MKTPGRTEVGSGGVVTTTSWTQAWEPAIAAIGRDFSSGSPSVAADAVEAGAVRRFCEALELGCPLHHDAEVARQFGFRDIVAPASGVSTWVRRAHWRPGDPTRYATPEPDAPISMETPEEQLPPLPEPPGTRAFVSGIETEYVEPVCVGDRLVSSGRRLLSVTPKETSVGRGAFMTLQSEVHNQDGALVARINNSGFHYSPHPNADSVARRPAAEEPAAGPSDARAAAVDAAPADWAKQRYIEEIEVGDEVPPVAINLTVARLVVEAGANRDFSPVHYNSNVAHAWGAPAMFANSIFIQGWWERAVREYIGLAGRVRRVGPMRMGVFNTVGETVVTSGVVRRVWDEDGDRLVELEMRSEISRGVSVGPGPVVVSLPTRGA